MIIRTALQTWALASIALLAACATTVNRGHLKEDEVLANLHPGATTQAETRHLLGSPSSQSTFGPATWYYVSSVRENRALFAPVITNQHVTEIAFDAKGVVTGVKEYNLSDSKDVQVASRVTPSEGQSLGFFEQIVSNLGRFNKKDDATSNSHTHGNGGVPGAGLPTR